MTFTPSNIEALEVRLHEAADWLADDLPPDIVAPQYLEGDVTLDQLDAYCVEIMREAAEALKAARAALPSNKEAA